jgi:hypothetical protein
VTEVAIAENNITKKEAEKKLKFKTSCMEYTNVEHEPYDYVGNNCSHMEW